MSSKQFHILVVDQHRNSLEVCTDLLKSWGYRVTQVSMEHDAIALMSDRTFDLVIANLQMPEMGVRRILEHAREKDPPVPVIVLAAFGSVDRAVEVMRQGAADYVRKPLSPEKLQSKIESILKEK
ncbi:MAG: response regulator [Gemmatimonadota bacterium]|nr:MAG: response regulator [Gemmatimonadota bacterium]